MSDSKKGDRVLVEVQVAELDDINGIGVCSPGAAYPEAVMWCLASETTRHPGVPVADLMREADLAKEIIENVATTLPRAVTQQYEDWIDLKGTREASKPKLKEGQEVTIRGVVKHPGRGFVLVSSVSGLSQMTIHPDDIRTEEP